MSGQQDEGEDQRDGAGLEQRQHEQHRAAGLGRQILAEDHHRAAEAHDLPGDQEAHGILQAEHAERADQARRRAEDPARSAARSALPSQPARTAPGRPKPMSHSASGDSLNVDRRPMPSAMTTGATRPARS